MQPETINPFIDLTYSQALTLIVKRHADREALVFGESRWTFAQAKREIDRASARLHGLGFAPGEKIALWLTNRPEFLWLWFGAAQMGLVVVVINSRLGHEEAAYQIEQSDSVAVCVPGDGAFKDFIAAIEPHRGALPKLRQIVALDPARNQEVLQWSLLPDEAGLPAMATDPEAPALISYSSGTTALPKGALITHCVFRKAWDIGTPVDQTQEDRLILAIAMFGSMAMLNGVLPFWVRGAAVVVMERFDAERFVQVVRKERCNFAHLLPPMVLALAKLPSFGPGQLDPVRVAYLLSNDQSMFNLCQDELAIPSIMLGYGLTESTTVAVRNRWDDPREIRSTQQGKALPGVEIRIVDEQGKDCPPQQPGEILIRGYCIMKGYYRKPEETARAIDSQGWLHTGDYGVMDPDHRLKFICRLSEGYKTSGFNVSPSEVEAVLRRHPDVDDVAVFGRDDPVAGQVGVACVIPKAGASVDDASMLQFLKPLLASYKIPRYIITVDEFPLTAGTQKVQKGKLRNAVEHRLPASMSLANEKHSCCLPRKPPAAL